MGIFQRSLGGYPQTPNRRRSLLLAAVVAVLVVVIFSLLFLKKSSVADDFLSKMRKGDSKNSYAMTSDSFRFTTSSKDWDSLVARVHKVYTGKSKKRAVKQNPLPNTPAVKELHTYEVQGAGGPYEVDIYTVKEAGKLRISAFNAKSIANAP